MPFIGRDTAPAHLISLHSDSTFRTIHVIKIMAILAKFLAAACIIGHVGAFAPTSNARQMARSSAFHVGGIARRSAAPRAATKRGDMDMKYTLVLVRHGESTWNKENLFTGWVDVPLSEGGVGEAEAGAQLLKEEGFTFDLAYTSTLKRAIKTLWIILEGLDLMYIPIVNTWRLNERHYGALQGLNKQETVDKHGKEQVLIWRRSYDIPPPTVDRSSEHHPSNDPRYKGVEFDDEFTESLKTTGERFMPDWENKIGPDIKAGKKVIIAAHGNTLRALVQYLDNISDEEICGLNIPTGVPLIYELDEDLKPIPHPDAIAPLQGRYLGNQEEVRARIEGVANQTK